MTNNNKTILASIIMICILGVSLYFFKYLLTLFGIVVIITIVGSLLFLAYIVIVDFINNNLR